MVAVNKSTRILIDNFISTCFANISSENREKIKEGVVEIADSILEQSNKDTKNLDNFATKGDIMALKEDIMAVKEDIMAVKEDIVSIKEDIVALKGDMNQRFDGVYKRFDGIKYDLLKWMIALQVAFGALVVGAVTLALYVFK
ncbi:hypothetical protein ACWIUD_08490 [Helicobacter sp. 23-1044]